MDLRQRISPRLIAIRGHDARRPDGHAPNPAILKAAIPNGMVMIGTSVRAASTG